MAGGNNDDPVWLLVIIIAIVGLLIWMTWYFLHDQVLDVVRYLRIAELSPLILFDDQARACFDWLRVAPVGEGALPTDAAVYAAAECFGVEQLRALPVEEAMNYYVLTPTSLGYVSRIAMGYLRWIVMAVCLAAIYWVIFVSKRDHFKTAYNLETFIQIQAKIWPVINPIVKFNPSKHSARIPGSPIPDDLPVFAEALSPEEWISFHRIEVKGGIPDRERVRQAFVQQLGPRWMGYEGLSPYMLGLLAAFALKGVQKRDESDELLGRLSLCWSKEKGFRPSREIMAEVKGLLKDPAVGGKALEVANRFSYRTTAILGVLRWARFMGGVLAAAQFLWVRGTDRTLWYALNNLGRRSFHMEGAGAVAHYMAEEAAGHALPVPRFETAIVALNQYFAANQPAVPPHAASKKIMGTA